jgi:hypothetical protein
MLYASEWINEARLNWLLGASIVASVLFALVVALLTRRWWLILLTPVFFVVAVAFAMLLYRR